MNKKKSDLEERGLRGKVKYVEEQTYLVNEETGLMEDGKLFSYELSSYNEEGNIIKDFRNIGDAYSNYIIKYDPTGKIIKEEHLYDEDGSFGSKNIFKYDSSGQIIENNRYDSDGDFVSRYNYEYNSNENLVIKYYESDPVILLDSIIKYDSNGNEIEYSCYYSEGGLWHKESNKYDSNGNVIEHNSYNYSDESINRKERYKYDSKGNKIEQEFYNSDGSLNRKERHKYDSNRNIIESIYYDSEKKFSNRVFIEYEYDKHNNWIAQFVIRGGEKDKVAIRKIVYYGDKDENNYPNWDSPSYKGIAVG